MTVVGEPLELVEEQVHDGAKEDVGGNHGGKEPVGARRQVSDGDHLEMVRDLCRLFGELGGSVGGQQPEGVDHPDKRDLQTKAQHAYEAQRVHTALLPEFVVVDPPELVEPVDAAVANLGQIDLDVGRPAAHLIVLGEPCAQNAKDEEANGVDGTIDTQRVANGVHVANRWACRGDVEAASGHRRRHGR